ncbi:MAG: tetratricopeptide repeat protein [Akkermansiaceae bacterium]|nr:tetratricopeptide repeat protein [Akkermansiaceae bacterium]
MDPGEQFVREMLAHYPEDWDTRAELLDTLIRRGDYDEAVATIAAAPAMPVDPSHLYKMVEVYRRANPLTAVTLLNGMISANPDDPKAHLACADVYAVQGNGAKAREHYRRAVELRPEFRDREMEQQIGVNPNAPTVKLHDRKRAQSAKTQRLLKVATVEIPKTGAAGAKRGPAGRRGGKGARPPSSSSSQTLTLIVVLLIALALVGGLIFWLSRR